LTREDVGGKTVLIGLRALRKADCEPRWTRHLREKYDMAAALKLSDEQIEMAKPYAAAMNHSIAEQIGHWVWLGKAAEGETDSGALFSKVGNADKSVLALQSMTAN
jgi:hypothetical protein